MVWCTVVYDGNPRNTVRIIKSRPLLYGFGSFGLTALFFGGRGGGGGIPFPKSA